MLNLKSLSPPNTSLYKAESNFPHLFMGTDFSQKCGIALGVRPPRGGTAQTYLLDFSLQVPQLHALLQVLAVLLGSQVQLLLLLVEELQQILDASCHVYISVTKQLNTCNQPVIYIWLTSLPKTNSPLPLFYTYFSSSFSKFNLILRAFA